MWRLPLSAGLILAGDYAREATVKRAGATVAVLATALLAAPARAETVVRWVTTFNLSGFEPYAYDNLQTMAVQDQVFERLVCYDWQDNVEPCLAASWKQLDPLT